MPENIKNIPDAIQAILDKNKGILLLSKLPSLMSDELRGQLGLKRKTPVNILMKKLEPVLDDRFIFRKKGRTQYILKPCDPSELVLAELHSGKPAALGQLVKDLKLFAKEDIIAVVNELVEAGKAKIKLGMDGKPQIFSFEGGVVRSAEPQQEKPAQSGEYTRGEFKAAYDELHREREFVRICDLRRKLGWPREAFDEMVRELRDSGAVHMAQAENRYYTNDELADCWMDENNYRMGTIDWNGR